MEKIIEKLETIKTDAYYYVDDEDNEIRLTIDDFEGFDEDWSEVERELENHKAVEEVLEWLEENADEVDIEAFSFEPASDMDSVDSGDIQLMPLESDEEWAMVQEVLNTFIDDEGNFNA